jgi:hypothetical protein
VGEEEKSAAPKAKAKEQAKALRKPQARRRKRRRSSFRPVPEQIRERWVKKSIPYSFPA